MANARPDRPTSFEGGATEGEEDDDNNVDKSSPKDESLTSNNKQNGVPPVRNVDRYGFMGGDQYTSPEEIPKVTLDIIRKREVKWVEMFENWEKWMTKRFKRVRARCRKGIPPSLRARAWQYLCGSKFLMDQNQGKFEEYLHKAGDPKWIEDIHKDLHRQFPLHEIFALRGGHGQEDLFRILKAYTIHNPQDGYCQAQGPIAAVLLMHMPAEQAFWCLVSICEKYLPGYYSPGLEAVHIDGDVLFGLLKKSSPLIYKHLKKQKIEPILYMTEWFMCIFSRTLPWTAVLRVWDMFFCEGVKVMFRIALVLFKLTLGTPEKLAECPTLYETMEKLRHIPHELIDGDFISKESLKLNVDEKDMEKEHQYQITKRRNLREKAQSSAKTERHGSKKKKKEKLLENGQKDKKPDGNSHLTFWKFQNKLSMKETHIEKNTVMTTVAKGVESEQILQQKFPVSESESESLKKSTVTTESKMQEMKMAKILAEEAFTAKSQQTLQPVAPDAPLSVEITKSSSEARLQQSQSLQPMTQTSLSDVPLSLSVTKERASSEAKLQHISSDVHVTTKRPLLEFSPSSEESKTQSPDENQLQQSLPEAKPQQHFGNTYTVMVEQQMHSCHQKDEKDEIHSINLAANLEPGQLLTYPISQIQTKSQSPGSCQQLIEEAENEHSYTDNQLTGQFKADIQRTHSDSIPSEVTLPVEMQTSDMCKSESHSPSPSRHLICKAVHDPIKTQCPNLTTTGPNESPQSSDASESVSSSGEVPELKSLFVNSLSMEPDTVECQQIQQSFTDEISNDKNDVRHQVEYFDDQIQPKKDLEAETISHVVQQVSPMALEPVFDEMQLQQHPPTEQSIPTKQPDEAASNLVNMHIVLEPNNSSTAENEIETASLAHQNQQITSEPLIVKSQQVLHSKKVKPKHSLADSQKIQSSQPLSTEIVTVKPQNLSSTFQMEASSISPESAMLPSDTVVVKEQSVQPVKEELAVESLLIKTQRPLQLAEVMSVKLKQLSLSAIEATSTEPSHLNLVSPKENPKSEAKKPLCIPDSIEDQSSSLEQYPNLTTDELVDEKETQNIQESIKIKHASVTEQLVQELSWQTVQHSNKDGTLISVGAEESLPPKYDSLQMKETHI